MEKRILVGSIIAVVILISLYGLSGCLFQSQGFHAEKIDEPPDNFINISEDRIRFFPHLKEAILNENNRIDTPIPEFHKVEGILTLHDTTFILYNDTYYEIQLYHRD